MSIPAAFRDPLSARRRRRARLRDAEAERLDGGEDERSTSNRLLRAVERRAQSRVGLTRFVLALVLYGVIAIAAEGLPSSEVLTLRQVEAGKAFVIIFGLTGLVVYLLAQRGVGTHVLPYVTAGVDAVLILGNLAYNHLSSGVPGNFTFLFPVIWVVPIALAANAIYFRPTLQACMTAVYAIGIPAISFAAGYVPAQARVAFMAQLDTSLGAPPNGVRLVMVMAAGLLLVAAALQGRRLLERAVQETTLRLNLTRYLPRELAPVLSEDSFAELRAGRRLHVTLLFVDIRASSVRAAAMDPANLARFISAFRRRVGRAASQHGGVVDKFIGDGALVVFGVPRPGPGDAARALACARMLCALVERWNVKRAFEPPVAVGIGVHCGEVFCGVVGEEARLEFTVLGDAVNVAARLESATKTLGGPILVSAEVLEAAGESGGGWRQVSCEPLPGMARAISIMTLAGAPPAAAAT